MASRFIQEYGFTVKVGQEEAFQKWLAANETKFAKAHPKGLQYIGTYSVVFTSEKEAGLYRMLLGFESYAAMDTMAESIKDAKGDFGRLLRDSTKFADFDNSAPWSSTLMKRVVDASIWDPKT